ncbi:MAG: BatA domain-containing protein, partial [Pseudomonadota bacterium]
MTLGPFLFAAPLALIALVSLPVIWWVLRATPPMPKEADLPSLRLLDGVDPRDETPARTPWWILLLRIMAAALAIIGLAQPVYAPGAVTGTDEDGPLLIVLDDGWPSAARWSELIDAATASLDTTSRDTAIHLLTTAPSERPVDPGERLTRQDMSARLGSLEPKAWLPERGDALERLETSGLTPARILWVSDGMDNATGGSFAQSLAEKAPLTVFAAVPRLPLAITAFTADATGGLATLARASDVGTSDIFVSALSRDGTAIATAEARFEPGDRVTGARFDTPPTALSRADRFRITGSQGAGSVWLWDSAARRQRVGLVSDGDTAQPLLSDLHYVRRALEPFSLIDEGTLQDLLLAEPDAIVLPDIGEISDADLGPLTEWVEAGGALIRFAGPRLAAQGDTLLPTPLRRS